MTHIDPAWDLRPIEAGAGAASVPVGASLIGDDARVGAWRPPRLVTSYGRPVQLRTHLSSSCVPAPRRHFQALPNSRPTVRGYFSPIGTVSRYV